MSITDESAADDGVKSNQTWEDTDRDYTYDEVSLKCIIS